MNLANWWAADLEATRPRIKLDRRRKPRISDPVPIIVRGSDRNGKNYRFNTIACNIGAGGVCAAAPRSMAAGEEILLYVRFALAGSKPSKAPAMAARAVVLRTERRTDGSYIFAASFLLHRFL
jgi:hypothetical protein